MMFHGAMRESKSSQNELKSCSGCVALGESFDPEHISAPIPPRDGSWTRDRVISRVGFAAPADVLRDDDLDSRKRANVLSRARQTAWWLDSIAPPGRPAGDFIVMGARHGKCSSPRG